MAQLKKLSIIEQVISAVALKEVLHHEKELVIFGIHQRNFQMVSGFYNDILDTVKEHRNGTKLEIGFLSDDTQVLVPQRTIEVNENWLVSKQEKK